MKAESLDKDRREHLLVRWAKVEPLPVDVE